MLYFYEHLTGSFTMYWCDFWFSPFLCQCAAQFWRCFWHAAGRYAACRCDAFRDAFRDVSACREVCSLSLQTGSDFSVELGRLSAEDSPVASTSSTSTVHDSFGL